MAKYNFRINPKRDENEPEVIAAYVKLGVSAFILNGKNIPDLLCMIRGAYFTTEVKSAIGRVSEGQETFSQQAKIFDCPHFVVRNIKDCIATVKEMKRRQAC